MTKKKVGSFNSRTQTAQQQFERTQNINHMVSLYRRTGEFSDVQTNRPIFADTTVFRNLQDHLNSLNNIKDAFAQFPAKIRLRFNNNVNHFVKMMSDNQFLKTEAVDLGLVKAPKPEIKPEVKEKSSTEVPVDPPSGQLPT